MRKLIAVLAIVGLWAVAALGLASCGKSSGGKEGGTLTGSFAAFPDYLDPALSYTAEGWTAMYDTYMPLLTYAHADGEAGSQVVPGLVRAMPKITNGGKTYTMDLQQGLQYSDGTPVKASDFTKPSNGSSSSTPAARRSTRTSSAPKSSPKRRPAASRGSKPTTRPATSSST